MPRICTILVATLLAVTLAVAQPGTPPPAPEDADATAIVETPEPSSSGDIVKLKGGSQLTGVQVLRSTPAHVEVEVTPGVSPLQIPRRQVESILYDDIDPNRRGAADSDGGAESGPDIRVGEKLSQALYETLRKKLSPEAISINNEDFVQVLRRYAKQNGAVIEFAQPVLDLPPKQRLWSTELKPNTSLLTLLEDYLLKTFKQVQIAYEQEKVQIALRQAGAPQPE